MHCVCVLCFTLLVTLFVCEYISFCRLQYVCGMFYFVSCLMFACGVFHFVSRIICVYDMFHLDQRVWGLTESLNIGIRNKADCVPNNK